MQYLKSQMQKSWHHVRRMASNSGQFSPRQAAQLTLVPISLMPMSYVVNQMKGRDHQLIKWEDSSFKTENLNLYSTEADMRA